MNERITPYDPELAKSITKEGQRIVRELAHELEDKISMNERIKELLEQADLQPYYNAQEAAIKKFAELIVKNVCNIVLHFTDVDEGVAVAKKHFGVKE